MKDWDKKYSRRFNLGISFYVVSISISALLLGKELISNTAVAFLVALIPVLPFIYAMMAVVGNVRTQDEMKQRIHLEAVLFTAFLTGGLTFTYGLLESAGLVPHLPLTLVAPFMIIVWGISNTIIGRRYG